MTRPGPSAAHPSTQLASSWAKGELSKSCPVAVGIAQLCRRHRGSNKLWASLPRCSQRPDLRAGAGGCLAVAIHTFLQEHLCHMGTEGTAVDKST